MKQTVRTLAVLATLVVLAGGRAPLVGQQQPESVAVINAIIALGKDLRLQVIAEGVETEAQHEFLLAHGVSVGQGFRLARPMPAATLEQWLLARDTTGAAAA